MAFCTEYCGGILKRLMHSKEYLLFSDGPSASPKKLCLSSWNWEIYSWLESLFCDISIENIFSRYFFLSTFEFSFHLKCQFLILSQPDILTQLLLFKLLVRIAMCFLRSWNVVDRIFFPTKYDEIAMHENIRGEIFEKILRANILFVSIKRYCWEEKEKNCEFSRD